MAKKKQDLIDEAKALGLELDHKGKISEMEESIEVAKAGLSDSQIEDKLHEAKEEAEAKQKKPEKVEELEDENEPVPEVDGVDETESPSVEPEKKTAKAGKRSAKALAEAEELEAKEERKTKGEEVETEKPKHKPQPQARPKIERRSKKYKAAHKLIDSEKQYNVVEAVELAKKTSTVNFDASLELHFNLNVDPKLADQNIRGSVVLPGGTGKSVRIAVYGNEEDVKAAKTAGADLAYGDELLDLLKKEQIDFDVLISTPEMMSKLGQFAKLLGPKGLMPNPKSGSVTKNVGQAVKEAKGGKVEYRVDKQSIVHVALGKTSFVSADLVKNAQALIDAVKEARPASIKGIYLKSAYLTTTMGPSIKLEV